MVINVSNKKNYVRRRALSLISGGLDSLLATKLILEQGVEVEGINFFTGFSGDHDYVLRQGKNGCRSARLVCEQLGIKLHVINIVDAFRPILHHPQYGYGAHLNPCLDCKLFMITQAKEWMLKRGFDFLITGEVLGQRPKSQRRDTLPLATKITGDLIVRPLSAKLLPPTLPENERWVKRELLCDFSGRTREPQIALAQKFGLQKFPQPGGGCLLTDEGFCRRLQDLLSRREGGKYNLDDVLLLRLGRHLCVNDKLKIIVGRDAEENTALEKLARDCIKLQAAEYPGALVVMEGKTDADSIALAARIAAYYSKGRNVSLVKVLVKNKDEVEEIIECRPIDGDKIKDFFT